MNDIHKILAEWKEPADTLASVATIIGVIVALLTFLRALHEYTRNNALKRIETYQALNKRFYEDAGILNVVRVLHDPARLSQVDVQDKNKFLTFFENIALMYNSGLIELEVAEYLFGAYPIWALNAEGFWTEWMNPNDWDVLRDFVNKLQEQQSIRYKGEIKAPRLRF